MEDIKPEGSEEKFQVRSPRGVSIAGVINAPQQNTDKIVVMSHGLFANKDRHRLKKASCRLLRAGFATLRYDFSSCGESESMDYDLSGNVDELKTVLSYARTHGYSKIALLGESFGGLVSLLGYDEDISTMVLWGPVTANRVPSFLQNENAQRELKEKGYAVHEVDGRRHVVTQKYVDDRNSIDRAALFSKIKCPVLIVHGKADGEVSYHLSEEAIPALPEGSKLILIENGNHTLDNRIDKVIEKTRDWLKAHLQ